MTAQGHTYTLVITQCDTGVSFFTFALDNLTLNTISILNKQSIDLKNYLHSINVRMPTDASFQRSVSTYG